MLSKKTWLKKNLSALLACASVLTFSVPVFAADADVVRGAGDEESTAEAMGGSVQINDGDSVNEAIGGMSSEGTVEKNTIEINGGEVEGAIGGVAIVNEEAQNVAGNVIKNEVVMHDGTANYLSGGEVGYLYPRDGDGVPDTSQAYLQSGGDVVENKVKIHGGTVNGAAVGGSALTGSARNNSVEITSGTVSGQIIGGMVRFPTERSEITGNTITIRLSDEDNPDPIPDLSGADLIGGMFVNGGDSAKISGNALNIEGISGLHVKSISGFDTLGFEVPATGDVMLNIDGGATNLDGTTINVGARGDNARADTGLQLRLIQNDSGLNISNVKLPGVFTKGHSFDYELELLDDDGNRIAFNNGENLASSAALESDGSFSTTGFHARVGNRIGGIKEPTDKLIPESANGWHRTIVPVLMDNNKNWKSPADEFREIQDQDYEADDELKIFAGVNGSSIRTKLSDGGHVNNQTIGFGLGGTKTLVNKQSRSHFSFAPIVDHGKGKFDTYTRNGEHGKGDTQFGAGGLIARKMNRNGFYYEGSFRYGRAKASFSSNDFPVDRTTGETYASYDMSAPILAGHINIGKVFAINRENTVHVYGQYFHSHQGSMAADLSSGEHYVFDSVDDGTFITGIRFIRQPNRLNKFYSGFAYQYEHSGGSSATYDDQSTHEVDSNGSSGMIELGWELKPHERVPWVVDLGAVGWIGQQKGLTFHAKVKKSF